MIGYHRSQRFLCGETQTFRRCVVVEEDGKKPKYFRIKNWDKYQHRDAIRGEGPMKFIRLDCSIIYDSKTRQLKESDRLTWLLLLAYCGTTRNLLEDNSKLLKSILGTKYYPNLRLFAELGLLEEVDASKVPATCAQNVRLEKTRLEKTREEDRSGAERSAPRPPDILEIWNKNRGSLPESRSMTKKRMIAWKSRWGEKPDRAYWETCVQKLSQSKFCRGENDRGWQARLDFLLRPDTHIKVFEDFYSSKEKPNARKFTHTPLRSAPQDDSATTGVGLVSEPL
jgi:hypothetical protein